MVKRSGGKETDPPLRDALEALGQEITRSFTMTADRVQEIFDDSVRRGRITKGDAERLADSLMGIVREQRRELLEDVEVLLDAGVSGLNQLARDARRRAFEGVDAAERALREAGIVGGRGEREMPIEGYDELTVKEVLARLDGLSAADLQAIREHERTHANRKSVLGPLDRRLRA
jgi:polyhydroxyalkanoate synthesis regulator phasin